MLCQRVFVGTIEVSCVCYLCSKGDLKANAQTANLSGGERVERSMSTESSDDFSGGEGPVLASPPGSPRKSKIIEAVCE